MSRRALVTVITVLAFSASIYGNVINVPADQPTIQAGIDAANDGDTVLVADGTYSTGQINMGSNTILLKSLNGPQATTIQGYLRFYPDERNASVVDGFDIDQNHGNAITVYDFNSPTIANCTFRGRSGKEFGGISIYSDNVSIINCLFDSLQGPSSGSNISIYQASNILVKGCQFMHSQGSYFAVEVVNCDSVAFVKNLAFDITGSGFLVNEGASNFLFYNNTVVLTDWSAIRIANYSATSAIVENNIIAYGGPLRLADLPSIEAHYNLFYENPDGDIIGIATDSTNLIGDPLFELLNFDYPHKSKLNLLPGSPAFDAGDPDPFFNDLDGTFNDIGSTGWRADAYDQDQDLRFDWRDNCPTSSNWLQEDQNDDGIGDACCCGYYTEGYTGNADCSADGKRNLGDVTRLIDNVYVSKAELCCPANGNVDGSSDEKVNLSDIVRLIDHVYLSKGETAPCN